MASRLLLPLLPNAVQPSQVGESQSDSESLLVMPQAAGSGRTNPVRTSSIQSGRANRLLLPLLPNAVQSFQVGESQSDSESLLVMPQAAGSGQTNPVRTGSNQSGLPAAADLPGPSGLSNIDQFSTGPLGRTSSNQGHIATDYSGPRIVEHANEERTSSQSDARDDRGSTHDGSQGQRSSGHSSQGSSTDNSQGTNGDREDNDIQGAAANQIEGNGNDDEGEEPMDVEGVVNEDESSNDSMSDFQEPKISAALASALNDSTCSSDDEAVSVEC